MCGLLQENAAASEFGYALCAHQNAHTLNLVIVHYFVRYCALNKIGV